MEIIIQGKREHCDFICFNTRVNEYFLQQQPQNKKKKKNKKPVVENLYGSH